MPHTVAQQSIHIVYCRTQMQSTEQCETGHYGAQSLGAAVLSFCGGAAVGSLSTLPSASGTASVAESGLAASGFGMS